MLNHLKSSFFPMGHHYPCLAGRQAFRMMILDRQWSSESGYRFGFNGQFFDPEIGEESLGIAFDSRGYSPSLARWFNTDNFAFISPGHSPYTFAACNPVFFIDPSGDTILPYQRVRTFLGKKFRKGITVSNQNVDAINIALKNLRSNEVFCEVERQLQSSTSFFQLIDTDITSRGSVGAQKKARGEEKMNRGSFRYSKSMGTRSDPFIIELNYKFGDLYGINPVTVFEEVLHAGQYLFYSANPSYEPSKLDIEIEAKLIKALEGFTDDFDYEGFDDFATAFKIGTATEEQFKIFQEYVWDDYMLQVSRRYVNAHRESPTVEQDYGKKAFSGIFLYFETIYGSNPLFPEPVTIEE